MLHLGDRKASYSFTTDGSTMPHQGNGIKWSVLIDHLKYQRADLSRYVASDIVFTLNEGKDTEYFAESFARSVDSHTVTERRKYLETYEPGKPNDLVINNTTARKIQHTVYRWRNASLNDKVALTKRLCTQRETRSDCLCPLPLNERRASAFLRKDTVGSCHGVCCEGSAFTHFEVVKTLLVYGEIDPLLRMASHLDAEVDTWRPRSECHCYYTDPCDSWELVYQKALDAYIALNVLRCFPALWDPEHGCKRQATDSRQLEEEYRNTGNTRECTCCAPLPATRPSHVTHTDNFLGFPQHNLQMALFLTPNGLYSGPH
ncbi:hypothetical protein BDV19DRAFT_355279 [Aspergillus venezuelensis]